MMRLIFWVVIVLLAALAVLIMLRFDQGYVLIVFPPWRVEISFVLMMVMIVGLFVLTYTILKLLRISLRLPGDVRTWRDLRRHTKAEDELSRAVAALISGEYGHARNLADKALRREASPMATLVAARGAAELGERQSVQNLLGHIDDDIGELVAARQAILRRVEEHAAEGERKPTTPA